MSAKITSEETLYLAECREGMAAYHYHQHGSVVQENVIRGGVGYVHTNEQRTQRSRRKTREVRGIDQNVGLNRALWTLAAEMAKLKA